jgi:chemotaxis protein MotB
MAYADFVTALMALFIVLWLMNSGKGVRQSISGYFRDPKGYTKTLGAGPASAGQGVALRAADVSRIRERIEEALRGAPDFQKLRENIRISVTGEGLRIELLESEQGTFFVTGSPKPSDAGSRLLRALAAELTRMGNRIIIEGHTDALPFRNDGSAGGYGNWELSADRANAARRLLLESGLPAGRVAEIRGFADQDLLEAADPNDARNRRVSVVVKL